MEKYNLASDLYKSYGSMDGQAVSMAGWARTTRASNNFGFIELNDGTCFKSVQIVFDRELENFQEISKTPTGSSLTVKGILKVTPDAKQPFEISARSISIDGAAESTYPLQKKKHSFEYLRTIAHLRPRTNTFSAVFRVRSLMTFAIHKYLNDNGFVYVATPCITTSDCEGAGETFRVTTIDPASPPLSEDGTVDYSKDFFGRESFMTVSGQLNLEPFAHAYRNVYTFGPSFRAENSNTPRHVAEFWQVEPEMAFCDLEGVMDTAEGLTKYVISYVLENAPDEMEFFDRFIEKGVIEKLRTVISEDYARVKYDEAVRLLLESGASFELSPAWGGGIQTEHERYLSEVIYKRPVFVTDYPKEIKAFYMRQNDDGKTVAATDLLFPGIGEVVGGSQREERYDKLSARIDELGLRREDYWWYLDLRRYGTCVHSGFGMGTERLLRFMTGMENIRDVIPYPRTPRSAEF
ncbi:MAG: asparagine--tRNA ligase [Oscillospiraceae bacterium]|nr:asparagine--tRNA ligase [Oscillospiraceae bacterium]